MANQDGIEAELKLLEGLEGLAEKACSGFHRSSFLLPGGTDLSATDADIQELNRLVPPLRELADILPDDSALTLSLEIETSHPQLDIVLPRLRDSATKLLTWSNECLECPRSRPRLNRELFGEFKWACGGLRSQLLKLHHIVHGARVIRCEQSAARISLRSSRRVPFSRKEDRSSRRDLPASCKDSLRLKPCEMKALSQYKTAMEQNPQLKTDRESYDWISEHLLDEEEELPKFSTWAKYLRKGRAATNTRKNKRGVGMETRSVVRRSKLDTPES